MDLKVPVLTRPDGQKSTSFTMVVVAFGIVSLWLVASMFTKIGPLEIRAFSGTEAMAYLSPILLLYFGRRDQELKVAKLAAETNAEEVSTPVSNEEVKETKTEAVE